MEENLIEAERRIEEAYENKASILDLWDCNLFEIPESILKLPWLKELDLGWNRINTISILKDLIRLNQLNISENEISDISVLKDLKQLNKLNLSFNRISDISVLKDLNQLTSLDLSDNNRISDISVLKDLNQLTSLDLSDNNQISDISALKDLNQLTSLNLSGDNIIDISALKDLNQLTSLDLRGVKISDISVLKDLNQLTSLNLSGDNIIDISALKNLNQLTSLYLDGDEISDISALKDLNQLTSLNLIGYEIRDISALKDLNQLTSLNLTGVNISDISALKDLNQLSSLYLNGDEISDISVLKDLNQLTLLDLSDNQISDISVLKDLNQLTSLDLSVNEISDISVLKDLKHLTSLDLSVNEISDIPMLKDLKHLTSLDLGGNEISDISVLKDLKHLTSLDLGGNEINDISVLKDLKHLTSLDLSINEINDISVLKGLNQLTFLNLSGNHIQNIPTEIFQKYNCANELFAYWKEIEHSQKITDNQLKIMLLGNGCTGKTTLLHWFIENKFKDIGLDTRTHGIIIKPLPLNEDKVLGNFWDFGGQEVYHATHRLFLGKRTLYILVWGIETRENEKETRHNPHYWLDMIEDIANKNERSRVLIVQNIFGNQKEIHLLRNEEIEDFSEQGLDISFLSVNAFSGDNIDIFKLKVEKEAQKLVNENVVELPGTWVNIRKRVTERREAKEKTLSLSGFKEICSECKLITDFKIVLDYLHRAGEVFYFENNFNNQIILDQEWALNAVYAVLKKDKIERFKGEFTFEDLKHIWGEKNTDITEEEAQIFLNFMLSNQIMFSTKENDCKDENRKFVIPQLLPDELPLVAKSSKNRPDSLIQRIEYAFLHRDIIERFIVRTAQFSVEKAFWKNGVFIEFENAFAIVEVIEEDKEKKINIECFGLGKEKLLQRIREEFNKIRPLTKAKEFRFVNSNWISISDKLENRDPEKSGFKYEPIGEFIELINVKKQVRNLIGAAKTLEAIELIENWADNFHNSELQVVITLIKADWNRYKADELMSITKDIDSRYATINKRILEIDWGVES